MAKSVLLTVSGTIPLDIHHQISSGLRPRADYLELAHGMDADLLDYSAAQKVTGRAGKILKVIGGPNLLLAYACWLLRNRYKASRRSRHSYTATRTYGHSIQLSY